MTRLEEFFPPEYIQNAYQSTGFSPIMGLSFVEELGVKKCCPILACARYNAGNDIQTLYYARKVINKITRIPYHNIDNFILGFDNQHDPIHESIADSEYYQYGVKVRKMLGFD